VPAGRTDVEHLVVTRLLGYNAGEGEQIRVFGPAAHLPAQAAETIVLAILDLPPNAIRYGALKRAFLRGSICPGGLTVPTIRRG